MLSFNSFIADLRALGLIFLIFLPIWWMLPFDLLQISYFGIWVLGTLRITPSDLMVVLMFAAMLLRGRFPARKLARLELIWPWLLLGILFRSPTWWRRSTSAR